MIVEEHAMPTSGQFVVVWVFDGGIWSDAYKWIGGNLNIYASEHDEWERCNNNELNTDMNAVTNVRYYTYEED